MSETVDALGREIAPSSLNPWHEYLYFRKSRSDESMPPEMNDNTINSMQYYMINIWTVL